MAKLIKTRRFYFIALGALLIGLLAAGSVLADGPSTSDVYWTWGDPAVGSSKLVRTADGVNATFKAEGLTPGNAVTGWFVVFNHPEHCVDGCDPEDIMNLTNPDLGPGEGPVQGDFLLLSGQVIGGSGKGNFAGTLRVGDNSGSGLAEVICPDTLDCTAGLTDPEGALIVLATHDHGPAQPGQVLKAQISSFLGGCVGAFNGDIYGQAQGPGDIPDAPGECSTIQVSPHMP